MTVNHDVTGSSPVRGAKHRKSGAFLFYIAGVTYLVRVTSWLTVTHSIITWRYSLRASPLSRWHFVRTPSLTECSRSNLHLLTQKRAFGFASFEYSEVVASKKQLITVFCEAKPPQARNKQSRVYRGDSLWLCDGGETCAWQNALNSNQFGEPSFVLWRGFFSRYKAYRWHQLNTHCLLRKRLLISPLANVARCHWKHCSAMLYSLRSFSSPVRRATWITPQFRTIRVRFEVLFYSVNPYAIRLFVTFII